ncbi:M28 family metallopeptidase [Haloferula sargassicola]|uniref:Peptidase M28 domain-containing protein n=1 Tax=Haloferula sargassicola TaxID=490096 RepID=A0ABP9UKW5_9BACT
MATTTSSGFSNCSASGKSDPLRFLAVFSFIALLLVSCKDGQAAPSAAESAAPWKPLPAGLSDRFSDEKAYQHVSRIVSIGPRPPESEGFEKTLRYLEEQLTACGWTPQRQPFRAATPVGPVSFTNLIARHQGDRAPSTVVLGGHIDSKKMDVPFVGANDGGSSTGILLELARVLDSEPGAADGIELAFFDGEEAMRPNITPRDGLYGSKYYAHSISARPARPRFGVVLDIVGDGKFPLFFNADTPAPFREAVVAAADEIDFPQGFGPSPGLIIDDHVPLQQAGIPCLHLIGDFTVIDYWHTERDTLENISPEMLGKVGRLTLDFLSTQGLADSPGSPAGKAEEE